MSVYLSVHERVYCLFAHKRLQSPGGYDNEVSQNKGPKGVLPFVHGANSRVTLTSAGRL